MNKSSTGIITTLGETLPKITKKFKKICEKTNGKFYIINKLSFCFNGIKN